HRVQRLRSNARVLRRGLAAEGFPVADLEMPIVPLIVGEERAAMRLCQEAIEHGVFAQAIRPPTVAAGTSRLRLTAMASHTASELRMAAHVFGEAARKLGLDPAAMAAPLAEQQVAAREREAARARLATIEAERPFDMEPASEEALFDVEREEAVEQPSTPPAAERPNAPFDLERELSSARAA
ncbi:MAG TPA: aminotransferase class I/II-fold pyridoxal phosphate-dependent enzyme, partial [Solirubrobacteraceae bacterium]|nr:aminotransferase class I/II-fold pyridoxal phosphate-dependent enzyme [Solirubrobacteraceae bacterium]